MASPGNQHCVNFRSQLFLNSKADLCWCEHLCVRQMMVNEILISVIFYNKKQHISVHSISSILIAVIIIIIIKDIYIAQVRKGHKWARWYQ